MRTVKKKLNSNSDDASDHFLSAKRLHTRPSSCSTRARLVAPCNYNSTSSRHVPSPKRHWDMGSIDHTLYRGVPCIRFYSTAREIKNPFWGLSGITLPGLVRSQFRQEISQVARSTSTITGTRFLNRGYFGRIPLVFGQKS